MAPYLLMDRIIDILILGQISTRSTCQPKPLTYDGGCSCALHSNCTRQALIVDSISHQDIALQGLKMGCTPSDSFRVSTLECFFNHSCLDVLRRSTIDNTTTFPTVLSLNHSRFDRHTTIEDLFDQLFIEQWWTASNYVSYYEQCAPSTCAYTYHQRHDFIHVVTILFGLHGSLSILLDWICPKLVQLYYKVYERRMRRRNAVHAESYLSQSVPSPRPSETQLNCTRHRSMKWMVFVILLLCLIALLVLFSIRFTRLEENGQLV